MSREPHSGKGEFLRAGDGLLQLSQWLGIAMPYQHIGRGD